MQVISLWLEFPERQASEDTWLYVSATQYIADMTIAVRAIDNEIGSSAASVTAVVS